MKRYLKGNLMPCKNVPYFSEIIMIRGPNLVHKTLLESLFSTHFNEIKSHFKNFAAQHARREAFFLIFFYKKRFKRAFPTHFEAVNASKDHPTRQSHLREPMHGDMGFMCYLNIHFIAQIQLFSLFLFQSKVGPSKYQTLSRKHIQLSLHAYGSHF